MSEHPEKQQANLTGLRDQFPGFFAPDEAQVRDFITTGTVAFDTNALLDVYRLNPQAREEYFAALRGLGNRLFVPHRVGREMLEHRLAVIEECSTATEVLARDLSHAFTKVTQLIRAFGNRRGLSRDQVSELESLSTDARDVITRRAAEFYNFGMDLDASSKDDPILAELVVLLDGKVGPPLADAKAAEKEAMRRIDAKIPPGFMDANKIPDRAIGDYLIWRQIMERAAQVRTPIILVTNDQKADWVRVDLGRKLGAHPELVAEMIRTCGVPFHLVNVQRFLVHAREYLGASVSDSTVNQAEDVQDITDSDDWVIDPDVQNFFRDATTTSPSYTAAEVAAAQEIRELAEGRIPALSLGATGAIIRIAFKNGVPPEDIVNDLLRISEGRSPRNLPYWYGRFPLSLRDDEDQ